MNTSKNKMQKLLISSIIDPETPVPLEDDVGNGNEKTQISVLKVLATSSIVTGYVMLLSKYFGLNYL